MGPHLSVVPGPRIPIITIPNPEPPPRVPRTRAQGQRTRDTFVLGPIFAREFLTVPRRASHYTARAASLGLLWVVGVTAWLATNAFGRAPNLGDSARFGLL